VAQVIEHLPSKHETLSLNSNATNTKKNYHFNFASVE
jgi:hypothetical protein